MGLVGNELIKCVKHCAYYWLAICVLQCYLKQIIILANVCTCLYIQLVSSGIGEVV